MVILPSAAAVSMADCICGVLPSRIRFRMEGVAIITSQARILPFPPALSRSCCESTALMEVESSILICG